MFYVEHGGQKMNEWSYRSAKYKRNYAESLKSLYGTQEKGADLAVGTRSVKNHLRVEGGAIVDCGVNLSGLKRKKKRRYPEAEEQIKLVVWLRKENIWHQASPNARKRPSKQGDRLKQLGMSPGFPDVEIPVPRGGYHGLYIELKPLEGGRIQDNQLAWQAYLRSQGYCSEIIRGFEAARDFVIKYLSS